MKLYELTEDYQALINDNVNTDTGEIIEDDPKDFLAKLIEIKAAIGDKSENIAKLYLGMQGDIKAISAEENRLLATKKRLERKSQWLKDYLLDQLAAAGLTEIKRTTIKISIRSNPPSVKILDEEAIPKEWKILVPETWIINKRSIIDHYKATQDSVTGTEVIVRERIDIK